MDIREMTKEQLAEESSIDIAYEVLAEKGEHLTLRQLMDEVRKLNGVTVRAMAESLHRVNTNINTDGRFLSIDDIRWGLREWYPVDQLEAETAPVVRTRRKRRKSADSDEEIDEDDDLLEEVDEDGFDIIDEEDDEEEEVVEVAPVEGVEIDEDLLDEDKEDEEEAIPDDVVFDDDDEDEEDEEEE